ncbi:Uncharacterised protein [Salmonella enterica subsp. enterica serovar Bovismorbificans]|uniref:Uncharacterized protein n=1 Tax=Salmonella enterica subsp. enterica serovar Bovismorbificans TaxID=58097 RepID=A0A655D4N0_SALET|nr:Uncharacterised protein [Salmonella enterica subsp. enterica serovar Bovismorbificans]
MVNRLLRQTASGALTIVLFKALLLLTCVRQFVETIRQLNTFVVHLKALGDAMILGTDLCQRCLTCRKVINKGRLFFTYMRLNPHREQQLQQRITVFFRIGDIA